MRKKYIIDKEDLPKLIKGESMTLANGGAFSIEVNGAVTNGDVIKAMFPTINFYDMSYTVHATAKVEIDGVKGGISYDFWREWWNSPYKECDKE